MSEHSAIKWLEKLRERKIETQVGCRAQLCLWPKIQSYGWTVQVLVSGIVPGSLFIKWWEYDRWHEQVFFRWTERWLAVSSIIMQMSLKKKIYFWKLGTQTVCSILVLLQQQKEKLTTKVFSAVLFSPNINSLTLVWLRFEHWAKSIGWKFCPWSLRRSMSPPSSSPSQSLDTLGQIWEGSQFLEILKIIQC